MADFLSAEWFDELSTTLREAGPAPLPDANQALRIVIEFPDAPTTGPHAMTICLSSEGSTVDVGDHLAADAIVRLSYADAVKLYQGDLDSATALREGRIKVRGDVKAIVPMLGWLQQAHPEAV